MPWDEDGKKGGFGRRWGDEGGGREAAKDPAQSEGAKVDELIRRAEPMIEQLNNLYAQYFAGVEKLPPNERRKQLEGLMSQLSLIAKPNATYRFRADTLHTKFTTFRERWDKMLRDLELGRIRRK